MELNRHQHLPMEAMDHHTLRRLHQEIHPRIHELIQSKLLEDLKDLTLEPRIRSRTVRSNEPWKFQKIQQIYLTRTNQ